MAFEKKPPEWLAEGTEPPASLKQSGFTPGYKPPAEYFNWFWNRVSQSLNELHSGALPKAGGTMTGPLNMGSKKITALAKPTEDTDAVTKAYADTAHLANDLIANKEFTGYVLLATATHNGWGSSSILLYIHNAYSGTKFGSLVSIQVNGNASELFVTFNQLAGVDITSKLCYYQNPEDKSISFYCHKYQYENVNAATLARYGDFITVNTDPKNYVETLEITGYAKYEASGITPERIGACPDFGFVESTEYPGCYYREVTTTVEHGTITEKEWLNPPMRKYGVPYRTTKRFSGSPVYAMQINIGEPTSNSTKDVTAETEFQTVGSMDYVLYPSRITKTDFLCSDMDTARTMWDGVSGYVWSNGNSFCVRLKSTVTFEEYSYPCAELYLEFTAYWVY